MLTDKKTVLYNFFAQKTKDLDYFYEFASEALHIVIFENFVKSMTSCLAKLKFTPSFCFAFKIPDNPTATIKYKVSHTQGFSHWKCLFSCMRVKKNVLLFDSLKMARKSLLRIKIRVLQIITRHLKDTLPLKWRAFKVRALPLFLPFTI